MIVRTVRLTFLEGESLTFWKLIEPKLSLIRNFQGCSHLEIWQDLQDPNVMTSYSIWESEEHLNAYRKSSLFGEVWPQIKVLLVHPAQANSYVQKINLHRIDPNY